MLLRGDWMDGYREFLTEDESREWGKAHYGKWANNYRKQMRLAKGYTKDDYVLESIERYCGYNYKKINEGLRNGFETSNIMYRMLANVLSMILCGAPRIPDNIVLYRVVGKEAIQQILKNNELYTQSKELGFLSTSMLKSIVNNGEFARGEALLKMYVKKGTVGVYVNEVTCRNEEEILLPPGLFIRILGTPYLDKIINKLVYECEVIDYGCNTFYSEEV